MYVCVESSQLALYINRHKYISARVYMSMHVYNMYFCLLFQIKKEKQCSTLQRPKVDVQKEESSSFIKKKGRKRIIFTTYIAAIPRGRKHKFSLFFFLLNKHIFKLDYIYDQVMSMFEGIGSPHACIFKAVFLSQLFVYTLRQLSSLSSIL